MLRLPTQTYQRYSERNPWCSSNYHLQQVSQVARLGPLNVWQLEAPLQAAAPLPRTTNVPERLGEPRPSTVHLQSAAPTIGCSLRSCVPPKVPLTGENQVSFFFSLARCPSTYVWCLQPTAGGLRVPTKSGRF